MKAKYLLVEWPESQVFIGHPDAHLHIGDDIFGDAAYFVKESLFELSPEELEKEIDEYSQLNEQDYE